jgi:hypothetical protein
VSRLLPAASWVDLFSRFQGVPAPGRARSVVYQAPHAEQPTWPTGRQVRLSDPFAARAIENLSVRLAAVAVNV